MNPMEKKNHLFHILQHIQFTDYTKITKNRALSRAKGIFSSF